MNITLLKLNGTTVPGIKEWHFTPEKAYRDSSGDGTGTGRDLNGNLHLDFVGVFPTIEITLRAGLTGAQISQIMRILCQPSFQVEYYDDVLQSVKTGEFYADNPTLSMLSKKSNFYDETTFSIIPLSKSGDY